MSMPSRVIFIFLLCFVTSISLWPIHIALYYLIRRSHSRSYYRKIRSNAHVLNRITHICFWNISSDSVALIRFLIILKNYVVLSTTIVIPAVLIILNFTCDILIVRKVGEFIYWCSAVINCGVTIYALRLRNAFLTRNEK